MINEPRNKSKEGDERVADKNEAGEELRSKKEKPSTEDSDFHQKAIDFAVAIEIAMMVKFKGDQAYSMKARSLIFNLKKNTSISARILRGDIEPERFV